MYICIYICVYVYICTYVHVHVCLSTYTHRLLCGYAGKACDAVCCSVLQCVAVCCSVLQCVTVCCSELQMLLCVEVLMCGYTGQGSDAFVNKQGCPSPFLCNSRSISAYINTDFISGFDVCIMSCGCVAVCGSVLQCDSTSISEYINTNRASTSSGCDVCMRE